VATRSLKEAGYDVYPVEEQMEPDPEFSTVKSPNPEYESAFELAKAKGDQVGADILIATDPDGDRLGVMAKHEGKWQFLTGNQTAAIFTDYILCHKKKNGTLRPTEKFFHTIVSSEFAATIARSFGVEVVSTLTGFKFIGDQMNRLETDDDFAFAYEESYGYILSPIVRDKDSLMPSLLISEIANMLKKESKTLIDYLNELYETFGTFRDKPKSIVLKGREGSETIKAIMTELRSYEPKSLLGRKLIAKEDYLYGTRTVKGEQKPLDYPESNVLKFIFENDCWFVLRPSGTEPKLKLYMNLKASSIKEADLALNDLESAIIKKLEKFDI
jgi:phosphoglucomutase